MATETIINADEIVKHWTDTSDADFEVMLTLLEARYDDYKRKFYAQCTAEYTAEWSEKIKQLRIWIKERL